MGSLKLEQSTGSDEDSEAEKELASDDEMVVQLDDYSESEKLGTPLSTDNKPSLNFDATPALWPGVYAIVDTTTGKAYYGESDLLAARFGSHRKMLAAGTHDNQALQEAWDTVLDPFKFQWVILEWGPAWAKVETRKAKEIELIKANADKTFNNLPGNPQPREIKRPIECKGVRYESSRDAATKTGLGRTTILRYVRDPNNHDWSALPVEEFVDPAVFAQIGKGGKTGPILFFSSTAELIEAGYAGNAETRQGKRQLIYRRINNPRYPNWRYAELDNEGKPSRKTYKLKQNEKSYKEWLKEQEEKKKQG